ncbi:MAG: hypothetical protein WDN46_19030 [Methylocella sp.]
MSESAAPGRQWPDYIDAELAIDRTQSLMLIGGLAARSLETAFGGEREALEELFTMALGRWTKSRPCTPGSTPSCRKPNGRGYNHGEEH